MKKEYMKEIENIGRRIKAARTELRLSQRKMAAQMDMSPSYFSEIEAGKKTPGAEFILKLTGLFNINPNYLFIGRGEVFLGEPGRAAAAEFDFDREIETVDELVWLMERSLLFKNTVMGFASRVILENEQAIKKSITKKNKNREVLSNE